jgi:hypothetical protein
VVAVDLGDLLGQIREFPGIMFSPEPNHGPYGEDLR